MILARISRAVREQNWFAVALEFVIVIAGVVIGFQVTAWNAERAQAARTAAYLDRFILDLSTDAEHYEIDRRFRLTVLENGEAALSARGTTGSIEADWQLIRTFWNASQMSGRPTINSTYVELISAGELELIPDSHLRGALTQYYTNTSNPALTDTSSYRTHVRGLIPLHLQRYLWETCYEADGNATQYFVDCEAPADPADISITLSRLTDSDILREELIFWMSTQEVAAIVLVNRRRQALELVADIEAEQDGDPARTTP
ncbi:MAG: hypothetical protein DHS20C06_16800 [Hyphobacterium sp.]|nr:MAG: hypothetical protein DHS20C06_16800 [Hyphobacterium sp.]